MTRLEEIREQSEFDCDQPKENVRHLLKLVDELAGALKMAGAAYGDQTWGTVYALERALPCIQSALAKLDEPADE